MGYVSQRDGNLSGGWAASNFWVGGVRVLFSFSAGLLIYREELIIKNKVGFIPLSILLIGAFVFPFFPKNWLFESVIVILYFPLLVSLGAGSTISEKIRPICEFAGNISYPLYMSHYAFIWIFSGYLLSVKPQTNELIAIVTIGTMLLILWAWFVMVKFDIPLRNYLRKKLL